MEAMSPAEDGVLQRALDMLKNFTDKEMTFALGVLEQIPQRRIDDNSYVCEYGYVHGEFNQETKEALEESEEIIKRVKAGDRSECMTLEEFFAETQRWLEEDDEI